MRYIISVIVTLSFISCNQPSTEQVHYTQADLELKINALLGEGPLWVPELQELYWVDIEGKALHIYNPKTKSDQKFSMPSHIGTDHLRKNTEDIRCGSRMDVFVRGKGRNQRVIFRQMRQYTKLNL